MNKKTDDAGSLRTGAEAQLTHRTPAASPAQPAGDVLHELQVHQIELEMQNEELRTTRAALEESRDRYLALYEFAPVGYLTLARSGQISEINLTGAALLGLERDKLLQDRFDHFIAGEDRDRWHVFFTSLMNHAEKRGIELTLRRNDGADIYAHLDCLRAETTGAAPLVHIALTDISAMRLNQQLIKAQDGLKEQLAFQTSLLESEERLRVATESARDAIVIIEGESGTITAWNPAAEAIFGHARSEALGHELHRLLTPPRFYEAAQQGLARFARSGEGNAVGKTLELVALHKDGTEFPIELSLSAMQIRGKWFATGIVRDITPRKQAEIALKHANRALATLSVVNRQLVYATDEAQLLQAICQAIVEHSGYRRASVGYVQQDADKRIRIMAHAGHNEGDPKAAQVTWAETGDDKEPGGRAIRSGATQLCQDIARDPVFSPWQEAALQHGYASCIAMPLVDADNSVFGIMSVYSDETDTFIPAEIALLEEMAGDLAFGVRTLRMRQEHDRTLEQNQRQLVQIRDNLDDTVRAIAGMVEMRDPYTAGHQLRVAALAMAIARQMGLPEEQVYAVHLAGVLHDLGKIQIPAEILSKPTKLTNTEYLFIKNHPQAGYDILQGIKFPWPIAQMVLQHHERLDGSGYPQGLRGDAILPEARILAVSDVVEAISSHRPYRPALGIESALTEIEKGSGLHYDPAVVAACIEVLRDHGMKLPT